jgi:hypothetical protein
MYFHLCKYGILPNSKELSTLLFIECLCLNCTLFQMVLSVVPIKFMKWYLEDDFYLITIFEDLYKKLPLCKSQYLI